MLDASNNFEATIVHSGEQGGVVTVPSETKDSEANHGATKVTKGALPDANEGETTVSTGVNGVGKIITSYMTIGST